MKRQQKTSFDAGFSLGAFFAIIFMLFLIAINGGNINLHYHDKRKYIVEENDNFWKWFFN